MKYRSLFISDVHLGLPHTHLDKLLKVLKENEFENLFLVGDIIDGWKLKRKFDWNVIENTFIQKIFKLARKGAKVHYLIGNHDDFLYSFEDQHFGNIEIKERYTHETLQGEKILILHGHQFDGIIKCNKWLQHIGSFLYEWLIRFNVNFNLLRHKLGLGYWSISKYLKSKTKEAVNYVSKYEETLVEYAKAQGVNSVMCGHIHTPALERGMINYYNTGDWVENSSFLVEDLQGNVILMEA